jgi:hypothetical protein
MQCSYLYKVTCMNWCNPMRPATTTLAAALCLGTVNVATADDIILPYPAGRPYYPLEAIEDTASPPSATVVSPPLSLPPPCDRTDNIYTVPSERGGTRQITIIACP